MTAWKETVKWWEDTWFAPRTPEDLTYVRIACGFIASLHFLGLLWNGFDWFGTKGWFNIDAGLYLIGDTIEGTGSFYRWSPLYWMPQAIPGLAGIGLLASLAMLAGIGARLSPMLAWFCASAFHHRAPLLTLLYEPMLVAMLAYLVIDTGRLNWTIRPGLASGKPRISVNIVYQLIRYHLWIWIAFSLASMLSNNIWWNGEAGWQLIQQGPGGLRFEDGWQWLGQVLTHLVVASQAAILFCMVQRSCNWLGRWMLYVFLVAMLLLLGDWMYAFVLFAASLTEWPVFTPHPSTSMDQ